MKAWLSPIIALQLVVYPCLALAESGPPVVGPDTRLYLSDGTVIMGHMVDRKDDLVIMEVDRQIFTFDPGQISRIITIDSLGSTAHTVEVTEFPYISFLGGTLAFGVISGLLFNRASDRDAEARRNEEYEGNAEFDTSARARELRDQADTARLLGWGSAALAVGTLGVAVFPRQTTRRVFPELSLDSGSPTVKLTYAYRF